MDVNVGSWQLTMERVSLAVAACAAVPIEHRAPMIAHLKQAFVPASGEATRAAAVAPILPTVPGRTAPTAPALGSQAHSPRTTSKRPSR
jgi:hypothetical protein